VPNAIQRSIRRISRVTIHVLCNHLVGEHHTPTHRYIAGGAVMAVGVSIAKSAHFISYELVQMFLDGTGYMIHGIGLIPFVEAIIIEKEEHEQTLATQARQQESLGSYKGDRTP
jgi:hypothetical protein